MKLRKVGEKSIKNAILHRKYMSAHGGPPPYTDEEILVIRERNRVWNEAIDEKNKGSKEDICDLLSPVQGLRELRDKDKAHSVAKRLLGRKMV